MRIEGEDGNEDEEKAKFRVEMKRKGSDGVHTGSRTGSGCPQSGTVFLERLELST